MAAKDTATVPFDALPFDPKGPRGNAWGRFGPKDELGTLNFLTPEVIVEAAREIRTGVRISLDWPLSMPSYPSFNRDPFKQQIILRHPNCIYDDILSFNSQGSTQWDGFRHYGELIITYLGTLGNSKYLGELNTKSGLSEPKVTTVL